MANQNAMLLPAQIANASRLSNVPALFNPIMNNLVNHNNTAANPLFVQYTNMAADHIRSCVADARNEVLFDVEYVKYPALNGSIHAATDVSDHLRPLLQGINIHHEVVDNCSDFQNGRLLYDRGLIVLMFDVLSNCPAFDAANNVLFDPAVFGAAVNAVPGLRGLLDTNKRNRHMDHRREVLWDDAVYNVANFNALFVQLLNFLPNVPQLNFTLPLVSQVFQISRLLLAHQFQLNPLIDVVPGEILLMTRLQELLVTVNPQDPNLPVTPHLDGNLVTAASRYLNRLRANLQNYVNSFNALPANQFMPNWAFNWGLMYEQTELLKSLYERLRTSDEQIAVKRDFYQNRMTNGFNFQLNHRVVWAGIVNTGGLAAIPNAPVINTLPPLVQDAIWAAYGAE